MSFSLRAMDCDSENKKTKWILDIIPAITCNMNFLTISTNKGLTHLGKTMKRNLSDWLMFAHYTQGHSVLYLLILIFY